MQISANGIAIEVDDQGPADGEPLLMIMGLGMQLVGWPGELVQALVARGFRVIRFDNRDTGLSQGFEALGVPNLAWAAMRYALHLPIQAPYSLAAMADDARGVMDALGLRQAHVCGASMGGMIAQLLAADSPPRVKSLVLMMTHSGSRHLPRPTLRVQRALLSRPDGTSSDAVVEHLCRLFTLIGSPAYPADPLRMRQRLRAMVERAWRPAGTARQLVAVAADGDRSSRLACIAAPTHIIHGIDDPLVPVAAAHDLGARIHGARVELIPGFGHDLPLQLVDRFADAIQANARRAAPPSAQGPQP